MARPRRYELCRHRVTAARGLSLPVELGVLSLSDLQTDPHHERSARHRGAAPAKSCPTPSPPTRRARMSSASASTTARTSPSPTPPCHWPRLARLRRGAARRRRHSCQRGTCRASRAAHDAGPDRRKHPPRPRARRELPGRRLRLASPPLAAGMREYTDTHDWLTIVQLPSYDLNPSGNRRDWQLSQRQRSAPHKTRAARDHSGPPTRVVAPER